MNGRLEQEACVEWLWHEDGIELDRRQFLSGRADWNGGWVGWQELCVCEYKSRTADELAGKSRLEPSLCFRTLGYW